MSAGCPRELNKCVFCFLCLRSLSPFSVLCSSLCVSCCLFVDVDVGAIERERESAREEEAAERDGGGGQQARFLSVALSPVLSRALPSPLFPAKSTHNTHALPCNNTTHARKHPCVRQPTPIRPCSLHGSDTVTLTGWWLGARRVFLPCCKVLEGTAEDTAGDGPARVRRDGPTWWHALQASTGRGVFGDLRLLRLA